MNVVFNFKLEETPFYYYFLGAHTSLLMIRNQEVASLFARIDVKLRGSHFFFFIKKACTYVTLPISSFAYLCCRKISLPIFYMFTE